MVPINGGTYPQDGVGSTNQGTEEKVLAKL